MLALIKIDSENHDVFADDDFVGDIAGEETSVEQTFFFEFDRVAVEQTLFNVHSLAFEKHFIGFFFYLENVFKVNFSDVFFGNKVVEYRRDIRFFTVIRPVERKLRFVYRERIQRRFR